MPASASLLALAGIVGFAGLKPTLKALDAGKSIGLANKETLVVAGDIVMRRAVEKRAPIIPVDSEHSAIFQCLVGETRNRIEKVILTASGGPFLGKKPNYLVNVKREHALQHPNWSMGAKITVDSATLMNKGLEVIEAHELFGVGFDDIDVVVHPQSIVHSMVEFVDGSVIAQLSEPDMRLPIGLALGAPERLPERFGALDFTSAHTLTFEPPDLSTFRGLALAYAAGRSGGTAPAILSAANEVAVEAFLQGGLRWTAIAETIDAVLQSGAGPADTVDDVLEADRRARAAAHEFIETRLR